MDIIRVVNDCATFLHWLGSAISSLRAQWNGEENDNLQGDVLQLQSDLKCLGDTLEATYNFIDRAEWRIHDPCVADLLPKVKEAVYDAEDLLDEFTWHAHKRSVEGNATELAPFIDFFNSVTQGSFNKVTDIQKRLYNLSNQLKEMGFHQATPRFDESFRPETTIFPTEAKIFGRDKEMKELISLLGVPLNNRKRTGSEVVAPTNNRRYSSRRKIARTGYGSSTSTQVSTTFNNSEETMKSVPVLPIVGIGGVGKTTLAQKICSNPKVKSHYELIIWICVSDDFDVKRLTKEALEQASRKAPTNDNLNSLQTDLADSLNKRRFLIVLDDIWDENKERWKGFYAPFRNVRQGSMMLVTTRSKKVADIVRTTDSFPLEGLKDDVFWKFFKLCAFGSDSSNRDSELQRIGKQILPKLRGSPLAAKTLGRLLGISHDATHWNNILNSELWQHDQEETEILPALRLSYMYLPFHLKRCFSFCAVYPKDHNFEKDSLAEMWVAEGFVAPKDDIPLQDIGSQYFLELVNRSFFQKFRGAYVIHDLMHDMAQLVSKEDCFIVKNARDIEMVPQNVRHLSILRSHDVKLSNLLSLCKHKKLRTLLCNKPLGSETLHPVMDRWFSGLQYLRVIFCATTKGLPESIGNLKHLRYLEISGGCQFDNFPSSFCSLYNLQIFYARKCRFQHGLPRGVSKLVNMQKFNIPIEKVHAEELKEELSFLEKMNQRPSDLTICDVGAISKDRAAEAELKKKEYLNSLTLRWSSLRCAEHNEIEVLQALKPPTNIKSVHIEGYPGEYLSSWFRGYDRPEDMSFSELPPAATVDNNNGGAGAIFSLLTEVIITRCQNLSSLEQFLHPTTYVPAIRKIVIANCPSLKSVPIEWSPSLEEINVSTCPKMTHLSSPTTKKLQLGSRIFRCSIDCSSLTFLSIDSAQLPSIELEKWSLPVLQRLRISRCDFLTFIGESEHTSTGLSLGWARARRSTAKFPLLTHLTIEHCSKLGSIDDLLTHESLPAIESITIKYCSLLSLPTERFESFPFLKRLDIRGCPRLYWQSAMVLPPSLQTLYLYSCGDFSAWSRRCCLENLTSLESLSMESCQGIVSIPGDLWRSNLKSLRQLKINKCPDLVSIGGPEAIANINEVYIGDCPKLMEIEQPRGNNWWY